MKSLLAGFVLATTVISWPFAGAINASPRPFSEIQEDGSDTGELFFRGTPEEHWYEDSKGFTVCLDPKCREGTKSRSGKRKWFYCRQGSDGELEILPDLQVGRSDPIGAGIVRRERRSSEISRKRCGEYCEKRERSRPGFLNILQKGDCQEKQNNMFVRGSSRGNPCKRGQRRLETQTAKHLVVPIVFSDHVQRTNRPTLQEIDLLMNSDTPDPNACPTGSLKQLYLENSGNTFKIESTVYPWITLPYTEEYYANEKMGISPKLHSAFQYALLAMDSAGFNLADFDQDNDGRIDLLTFLHSGYSAEHGGEDEFNAESDDRIYSHQWSFDFNSNSLGDVKRQAYITAPAIWGRTGNDIGRVGAIAHELAHLLGLPDLYDTDGTGLGIGSFSLMGNPWGIDSTQLYPPLLDAWSRLHLGWANVMTLASYQREISLGPSYTTSDYYKIEMGYPDLEYLLIENRRQIGFDKLLPQEGLVIYHIDELKGPRLKLLGGHNMEGYPGQKGWPENGEHYRVAILGADGNYDLERNKSYGDAGDVWHGNALSLGPGTSCDSSCGNRKYPNTDSYQGGVVMETGHLITEISEAQEIMTFDFVSMNEVMQFGDYSPSQSPSSHPSTDPNGAPSTIPTSSLLPSHVPSTSSLPTLHASDSPSFIPSVVPSTIPSEIPSESPSKNSSPSFNSTDFQSSIPSDILTQVPTSQPNDDSRSGIPSALPSTVLSEFPSESPSKNSSPSFNPADLPSSIPSQVSTSAAPSASSSNSPSESLSKSILPSFNPTNVPKSITVAAPSTFSAGLAHPSTLPSQVPSSHPGELPSETPSVSPSSIPTAINDPLSLKKANFSPSTEQISNPIPAPSVHSSSSPSSLENESPNTSPKPSRNPNDSPSWNPSPSFGDIPTLSPSSTPTSLKSGSFIESSNPNYYPNKVPSLTPSLRQIDIPTVQPTLQTFSKPTDSPTVQPFSKPTNSPTLPLTFSSPTLQPIYKLTDSPTPKPTFTPTDSPNVQLTFKPTTVTITVPTSTPPTSAPPSI